MLLATLGVHVPKNDLPGVIITSMKNNYTTTALRRAPQRPLCCCLDLILISRVIRENLYGGKQAVITGTKTVLPGMYMERAIGALFSTICFRAFPIDVFTRVPRTYGQGQ